MTDPLHDLHRALSRLQRQWQATEPHAPDAELLRDVVGAALEALVAEREAEQPCTELHNAIAVSEAAGREAKKWHDRAVKAEEALAAEREHLLIALNERDAARRELAEARRTAWDAAANAVRAAHSRAMSLRAEALTRDDVVSAANQQLRAHGIWCAMTDLLEAERVAGTTTERLTP